MNTRILDKVVGASAVLALAAPVALSAAPALAWTGQQSSGYGYQAPPDAYSQAPQPCNCQRSSQNGYEQHHRYGYEQHEGYEQHHRYVQRRYSYEQHERYKEHRYTYQQPQRRTEQRYGYNEYSRYGWRAPEVPPVRQPYVAPRVQYAPPPPPYVGSTGPRVGYAPAPPTTYRPYRPGNLVATVFLNERVGPNDAAPVRTVLPPGTPVRPIGPQVAGWLRVDTPMGPGWVFGRYIAPG